MSRNSNDNQNAPTEPTPDEPDQASNRDSGQDSAVEQLGELSPSTTTNPKIKNL